MAVDPHLLNGDSDSTWQNLGDWSAATTYPEAAEALAVRLGVAARLGPGDVVIDVGCGSGDQLGLWRRKFGVAEVHGYEPDRRNAARAMARFARDPKISVREDGAEHFDTDRADVVLSLDAAYHFSSRQSFIRRAGDVLRPGGRLALADLFVPGDRPDLRARALALAAGIPQRNLWTRGQWAAACENAGFRLTVFEDLTEVVLGGFGAFVRRAPPRVSLDGAKVGLTGLAAANAAQRGWLGFTIVVAESLGESAESGSRS